MTLIRLALPLMILAAAITAAAQTAAKPSPELLNLRMRFETESAAAMKPIQARYIGELQMLQRTLTQKGDLSGALAVQDEVTRLTSIVGKVVDSPSGRFRFADTTWESDNNDATAAFKFGGEYKEHWKKHYWSGTWKPLSDLEAEVSRNDGKVFHFKLDPEKGTLMRKDDAIGWHRPN